MTCIVGLVENNTVYIGGDSAGVAGYDISVRADAKVFRNGPFLMGFTSSFRMGQLLRWSFAPPAHPDGVDVERYMCTTFIDAVRECLKAGGYARNHNGEDSGGCFLVGYRGRLFSIESDFQVGEKHPGRPYHAVGCGSSYALGSLFTSSPRVDPQRRVHMALAAAAQFSAGVCGPFLIHSLPPEEGHTYG